MIPLTTLTPDNAAALDGPDWLRSRRVAAAERFGAATLPSADEEVWRYSRIGDLDLDRFHLESSVPSGDLPAEVTELLDGIPHAAGVVVVHNGHVVRCELDERWSARGVTVGTIDQIDDAEGSLGDDGDHSDVFRSLNDAFSAHPVVVSVPAGVAVDGPVVVVQWIDEPDLMVLPRLVVRTGGDAEVRVLDWAGSPDGVHALSVPFTELEVGDAARVGYCGLQVLGDRTWQIGTQTSEVGAQATLRSFTAAFGGEYARLRTNCRLAGRGSTGDLFSIYFGSGDQTLDFRTFQDHAAPDTTSNLLFKGAVDDRSRSVYTGMIQVRPDARGTNAFQTNRNVKLSPDAWAESVPNLQIENNDVHCSHASTVGPIDEDQQFYLESRGVPPQVAERLIVGGFFDEVIDGLPVAEAEAPIRARILHALSEHTFVEEVHP
ncbi:MAG: SufB/SufD family protein [Acidimicrobiales bacterium]